MKIALPIPVTRGDIAVSLLCVLAVGGGASTVAAATADEDYAPRMIVRFGDLDPSTPRDALALYRRIQSAANAVCWRVADNDLSSRLRMQACVQKAMAEAVSRIDRPALIAVYNAHNRPPLPTSAAAAAIHP